MSTGIREIFSPGEMFLGHRCIHLNIKKIRRTFGKNSALGRNVLENGAENISRVRNGSDLDRSDGSLKRPPRICAQINSLDECQEASALLHCGIV